MNLPRSFGPIAAVLLAALFAAVPTHAQWLQWGGPHRDFQCDAAGLANEWPADGPRQVWSRPITYAHSAIVVDADRLYTMCRRDDQDVVMCLKTDTGETVWETAYDASTRPNMMLEFGPGPHSTPLVVGDRLFTIGAMTQMHCFDKNTGKILWSHDLNQEYQTSYLGRGYGASPVAYRDLVIVVTGARGTTAGLTAFKQDTGEIAWQSDPFTGGYPTPILARINDEDHLLIALGMTRAGLDPATGKTRWSTTVDQQSAGMMATPLFVPPNQIFYTAAYGGGSRLLEIKRVDGEYQAEERWHSRKMKVQHGTVVRIDDHIYGSSGDFGPAYLLALNLADGSIDWRERGFAKSTVLAADGKLIILDERGNLALATATPEKLTVHSRVKLLEERAWTVPTLVGQRLYLRDYNKIMCLDLGPATADQAG